MYIAPHARAANAYRKVNVETNVDGASPHQLIVLLFDGLRQSLATAESALLRGDIPTKGAQIVRSVRFLEEGLKAGLDDAKGGELAANLRALYDYCISRLTTANLRNDAKAVAEVAALIAPLAQGWKEIGSAAAAPAA
ncbi:flagellar protein potentiates polymerization [Burkholderiales bacterium 8X]|nr:flagellar protein potentiates polymerization [Burkholderiales bacterium 8X]